MAMDLGLIGAENPAGIRRFSCPTSARPSRTARARLSASNATTWSTAGPVSSKTRRKGVAVPADFRFIDVDAYILHAVSYPAGGAKHVH